jgi:hypothetical protein
MGEIASSHGAAILSLFISSGVATAIVGMVTAILSRPKQDQANPNGERRALQEEVFWLRKRLEEKDD